MLSYLSFVIFFAAIVASAFVFFYKASAENALEAEKLHLIEERKRFDQSEIERLRALDLRLEEATDLMQTQASISDFLANMESSVSDEVRLSALTMTREDDLFGIEIEAVAPDFNAIDFQRAVFDGGTLLEDALYSDFLLQPIEDTGEAIVSHKIGLMLPVSATPYVGVVPTENTENTENLENTDSRDDISDSSGTSTESVVINEVQ